MIELLDVLLVRFVDLMWGTPLLILMLGGGLYFTIYSRFIPFKYIKHSIDILLGKYDNDLLDPDLTAKLQNIQDKLAKTSALDALNEYQSLYKPNIKK